jgi:hypothetical protein
MRILFLTLAFIGAVSSAFAQDALASDTPAANIAPQTERVVLAREVMRVFLLEANIVQRVITTGLGERLEPGRAALVANPAFTDAVRTDVNAVFARLGPITQEALAVALPLYIDAAALRLADVYNEAQLTSMIEQLRQPGVQQRFIEVMLAFINEGRVPAELIDATDEEREQLLQFTQTPGGTAMIKDDTFVHTAMGVVIDARTSYGRPIQTRFMTELCTAMREHCPRN